MKTRTLDIIVSSTAIMAIIIAIFSLSISLYMSYNPPPYKPNLELSTNLEDNIFQIHDISSTFLIFVYNGGDAPCMDLYLEYPRFLVPIFIKNYEYIGLSQSEITKPASTIDLRKSSCNEFSCKSILGFIRSNQILTFQFYFLNLRYPGKNESFKSEIKVSCVGDSETKSIRIQRLADPAELI